MADRRPRSIQESTYIGMVPFGLMIKYECDISKSKYTRTVLYWSHWTTARMLVPSCHALICHYCWTLLCQPKMSVFRFFGTPYRRKNIQQCTTEASIDWKYEGPDERWARSTIANDGPNPTYCRSPGPPMDRCHATHSEVKDGEVLHYFQFIGQLLISYLK